MLNASTDKRYATARSAVPQIIFYWLLNIIKQTGKKMVPGMIPIAALILLSREIVKILP